MVAELQQRHERTSERTLYGTEDAILADEQICAAPPKEVVIATAGICGDVASTAQALCIAAVPPSVATSCEAPFSTGEHDGDDDDDNDESEADESVHPIEGGLPSIGSFEHEAGLCRPCMYVMSKAGCRKGAFCSYCHLAHDLERRPCKAKRERVRKFIERMEVLIQEDPANFSEECLQHLPCLENSPALRQQVMVRLEKCAAKARKALARKEAMAAAKASALDAQRTRCKDLHQQVGTSSAAGQRRSQRMPQPTPSLGVRLNADDFLVVDRSTRSTQDGVYMLAASSSCSAPIGRIAL
mmetsp:Transcript_30038/g.69997  ORF Transcript_30038/g.69997 Transcript_30038/m.69997 type:complete len:299 (-) Transcript_30038:224-1120(-)